MQELSKRCASDKQLFIAICDDSTQRNNTNTGGTLLVIRAYVNLLLLLLLLLLLTYLLTVSELSLGGSSPYTSSEARHPRCVLNYRKG